MNLTQYHRSDFRQFVQDHLTEDPAFLLLKYQGKTDFDLKEAVQQISARQKAAKKLPSWVADPELVFPPSISLEQSSSEDTARLKAKGLEGKLMIDLTGGFGVDSYYVGKCYDLTIYCEQQEDLSDIVAQNLDYLAPGKFQIFKGDGLEFLRKSKDTFDLIYVDPARRGKGNQKMYKLQDCEPDVISSWELMKSKSSSILIKVSPMLDISQAIHELPDIQKVQVVSVKNEVKEVLLNWKINTLTKGVRIEAIDLNEKENRFEYALQEEIAAQSVFGEAEAYLIEPFSSIMKAGGFKVFGAKYGLKKLAENSHLYTSDKLEKDLPARIFVIVQEVTPKRQIIKKLFPKGKVNVITRNYAIGATDLKKKLGVVDGGEDFLIGTKSQSGFKLYWCKMNK